MCVSFVYLQVKAVKNTCRRLGASLGNAYGEGTGPILYNNAQCIGNETSLADCGHSSWGLNYCQRDEDVSIVCDSYTGQCQQQCYTTVSAVLIEVLMTRVLGQTSY